MRALRPGRRNCVSIGRHPASMQPLQRHVQALGGVRRNALGASSVEALRHARVLISIATSTRATTHLGSSVYSRTSISLSSGLLGISLQGLSGPQRRAAPKREWTSVKRCRPSSPLVVWRRPWRSCPCVVSVLVHRARGPAANRHRQQHCAGTSTNRTACASAKATSMRSAGSAGVIVHRSRMMHPRQAALVQRTSFAPRRCSPSPLPGRSRSQPFPWAAKSSSPSPRR